MILHQMLNLIYKPVVDWRNTGKGLYKFVANGFRPKLR